MNRIAQFMLMDFRAMPMASGIILSACFILGTFFLFNPFDDSPDRSISGILFQALIIGATMGHLFTVAATEEFHVMLPLTRDDIVKAIYLSFICLLVIFVLPSLFIKAFFFPVHGRISLQIASTILTGSFIATVLYPLYFRKGTSNIPAVAGALLATSIICGAFSIYFVRVLCALLNSVTLTLAATAAVGAIFLYLSYLLSLKIYRTRDL